MKEALVTDRINFLIWQYLLEGNYRETAAKFQKEWHIEEPQRKFDFAPYVKTNSLVDVVNLGLHYYDIKRQFYAQKTKSPLPRGVFGPDSIESSAHKVEEREDASVPATLPASGTTTDAAAGAATAATGAAATTAPTTSAASATATATTAAAGAAAATPAGSSSLQPSIEEAESTRKRHIDSKQQPPPHGSPVKKPRLSNGYDATTTTPNNSTEAAPPTPMDIDSAEVQHAYPSPMERDTASTPAPRTDGPEQSTQVGKIENLGGKTTFLRLAPTGSSSGVADAQQPGHDNPIVLHCEWNPQNPTVLAAAGTDTLARIWTIARASSSSSGEHDAPVPDHVSEESDKPYKDLIDEAVPPGSTVTALAWNPNGSNIALATESHSRGSVSIWAPDATLLLRYNIVEPPVFKLQWNPNGSSILGLNPENSGTMITVFLATSSKTVIHVLPSHDLTEHPLEAIWISETEFLLCGGSLLAFFRVVGNEIVLANNFNTDKAENFVNAQYDPVTKITATVSDSGDISLWNDAGERRPVPSQGSAVTALVWQPLQSTPPADERLLATGDEKGVISLWNARIPENKPKYTMKLGLPVVALAFTPDGAHVAAASPDHILIWKVGEPLTPRASWHSPSHPGWLSPKTNTDSDEEDTHSLCWDATGHKLAYAVNSRLAVISFR